MKKIRLFSLLLCAVMLLCICACSADAPREIVLWHSLSGSNGDLFAELIDDYNSNSDVKIKAVYQGSYTDATTKLRAALQADNTDELPDIIQMDATGVADVQASRYLLTADALEKRFGTHVIDMLDKAAGNNLVYCGELLALPFNASATVLYYNKTMLDKAGFTSPPDTLADIAAMLPALTKRSASGETEVWGMACSPNTPTLINWIGQQNGVSYMTDMRNGHDGAVSKVIFDSGGTMEHFLTEWKKLFETGGLKHVEGKTKEEFIAGSVAMYVASTSHLASILSAVGDSFEVGVAPFPRVDESASYGASVGGAGLFVFDRGDDARTAAAWDAAQYFVSAPVQSKWSMGTGYFPVNSDTYGLEEYMAFTKSNPLFSVAVEQLEKTDPELYSLWVPSSYQFYTELQDGIITMLDENKSAKETASSLALACNKLINDYNSIIE